MIEEKGVLDRLADGRWQAEKVVDPAADPFDEAVMRIEIARIGSAETAFIAKLVQR